jgi:hypothetical protein
MEVLYEDPVASLLQEFMEDKEEWSGSATKLLESLNFKATVEVSKILPKAPNKLSNYLTQIKSNLETAGIIISKEDNSKGRRIIIKRYTGSEPIISQLGIDDNLDTF